VVDLSKALELRFDPRLSNSALLTAKLEHAFGMLRSLDWKSGLPQEFPPIACLMGGTGTGKSTLFNSLVGRPISEVGVRRPCTLQAVIFVHEKWADLMAECPGLGLGSRDASEGTSGDVTTVAHNHPDWAGLIIVDTPDFDSVELSNRLVAESFFIVSDILLLVTSQEKYGDLSGLQVRERADEWGKRTVFVMNKVGSDSAFMDFSAALDSDRDGSSDPIRIDRTVITGDLIPGLSERGEFRFIFDPASSPDLHDTLRNSELEKLGTQTAMSLKALEEPLAGEIKRISSVNGRIESILSRLSTEMEAQLDAVVSENLESQMRERLQSLLRRYDILFVPRMMIRNTVRKVFHAITDRFSFGSAASVDQDEEKEIRTEDFQETWSKARIKPLESAVANLNRDVAELLASDTSFDDLRLVAHQDVERMGPAEIRAHFDDAVQGVEELLESEFDQFKQGLSGWDEMKLYGSYTLWALFLVTAEVAVGGGFTLLDAVLGSVIVPFIPKWLVNLKVIDLLRNIGNRVNEEYRKTLRDILRNQAELYVNAFAGLTPDEEALQRIQAVRVRPRTR
jgi:50S ribosome-binding GTPase